MFDMLEWISLLVFTPFICGGVYMAYVSWQDHFRRKALQSPNLPKPPSDANHSGDPLRQ